MPTCRFTHNLAQRARLCFTLAPIDAGTAAHIAFSPCHRHFLENIETANGEETLRFSTVLYFRDRKIALVSNGGTGGGHQYNFICRDDDRQSFENFIDSIRTNPLDLTNLLHRWISEYIEEVTALIPFSQQDIDLDIIINCAIKLHQLKKECQIKTLFRLADEPRSIVRTIEQIYDESLKAYLFDRYGNDLIIINELFSHHI